MSESLQNTPFDLDTESIFSSVLLIEDEPAHATLIQRVLKEIVGDVTHASTGKEALCALESSLFELVLSDLHLPDTTGIELIKAIRELRPGLPVIVLTSSNNLDDAVSAMREGAWDYLVKQFSSEFSEGIRLVIQRTAARLQQQMREVQLRAERRNFWAAAHAAQDGLAILSDQGSVVFANEAFRNFVRLVNPSTRPDEHINVVELIQLKDEGVSSALSSQLIEHRADSLWNSELQVNSTLGNREGKKYYFDLALSSVKLDEIPDATLGEYKIPEVHRYIFWVRDITRRKEQERFQRDLLSTTSHDLKGPLGAILTSAELLEDPNFLRSEKALELITRIASCARNSINIIDELLSARRIQDGVLIVKPKWYSVEEILEEIVLDYLPTAKAKSIEFSHRPIPTGMHVFADRLGLHRILGNLVSNAIKFTPQGGKVELGATERANEIEIYISDTGPGIEPKARHLLFERYARLESHQEIEGTGLGLYVTKNIVAAHNGRIEIKSELGIGTTFIVNLPNGPLKSRPENDPPS